MESWRKSRKLGAGSYGTVFSATQVNGSFKSNLVAVKSTDFDLDYAVTSLKAEGKFLAELNGQPNIVQCFGEDMSIEDGRMIYNLLLEYADGGSLQDLIKDTYSSSGGSMPETHIAYYASMLLRGLVAIHSQGVVHCDLKPANILVFSTPGGIGQLKIADFGLARRASEKEEIQDSFGKDNHNRGTPLYSSPESVAFGLHESCTDIWSLGCIIFEMMTGKYIWNCKEDLYDQILHGRVEFPPNFSEDGIDFLKMCLKRAPQNRWSALELLNHPFIVNNLKIMSELGINGEEQQHLKENPFGSRK